MSHTQLRNNPYKVAIASMVGTAIEFYDYYIYAAAAVLVFNTQFFPKTDETAGIIATLNARFPNIKNPHKEDICYATTNRQNAVKALATDCDIVIVVGSPNSSNSNRLREVALQRGVDAYMVDNAAHLRREWFAGKRKVGVTAGASAPEVLVEAVVAQLRDWGINGIEQGSGEDENIVFVLPKELR